MKKYLIIAAAAALTLVSCAKVENFSTKMNDGKMAINFSNYAPRALAKADTTNYVAGTELVSGADFDVWAWYSKSGYHFDGTVSAPNSGKYFSTWYTVNYLGDGAGTDGSNNGYPDGARYWPTGDNPDSLHFFAYYPSNAGTITAPADGFGDFSFTAADSAADQVDFMVADLVRNQVYGKTNASTATANKGTVNLKFRHQLTKVQVKFRTIQAICDDPLTTIKVDSAYFYHINNAGTLTASYVDAKDSTATAWSVVSGDATYDIAVPADTLTVTAANSGKVKDDIFLLVPQVMNAPTRDANDIVTDDATAQYIHVYWTVTTDGIETHNNRKVYLDECVTAENGNVQANIDWQKNNSIVYIITIAPNQILFTGSAYEWDDDKTGYYRVF